MHPQVVQSYDKGQKEQALRFARIYSKTFKDSIIVENYPDSVGITVWKSCKRIHDDHTLILFRNGIRKKASC